jgi:hypothetical protein
LRARISKRGRELEYQRDLKKEQELSDSSITSRITSTSKNNKEQLLDVWCSALCSRKAVLHFSERVEDLPMCFECQSKINTDKKYRFVKFDMDDEELLP